VAMPGAIKEVNIDFKLEPSVKTIDDVIPKGICGAGLISATAALLLAGIIERNGKFKSALKSQRIHRGKEGYEYILVESAKSYTKEDIVITEKDLENVIQTKAAIYAAICSLGHSVSIEPKDFEQVILAGCLGNSLDIEKAITIGLLPDIARERFVFIGNGSVAGARLITFSTELLDDSRSIAQMMTDVELNATVDYIANYKAALSLPNSDVTAFPSIFEKLKTAG
jgi:uncharacterized 2Fe-2S/4Fe-4S cluster protein (DUF4445 family)